MNGERNARIMRLWKQEGLSYSQIAERLGVTRNVVAGVVGRSGYRLDLVDRLQRQTRGIEDLWQRRKSKWPQS